MAEQTNHKPRHNIDRRQNAARSTIASRMALAAPNPSPPRHDTPASGTPRDVLTQLRECRIRVESNSAAETALQRQRFVTASVSALLFLWTNLLRNYSQPILPASSPITYALAAAGAWCSDIALQNVSTIVASKCVPAWSLSPWRASSMVIEGR